MTPILRHPGRRGKNLSMSAICCYRPDGSEARLAFGLREGAYDALSLVRQLDLLSSVLGGDPAIVIWDNLNVHKSHDMRAFVAAQAWLEVAWLPPYAPELNPAEGLWDARIDVKWRGAPRSRPGWRGRPRGRGSASRTA
jgi:transposase